MIDWTRWYLVSLIKEMNDSGQYPTIEELSDRIEAKKKGSEKVRKNYYLGMKRSPLRIIRSMIAHGYLTNVGNKGESERFQLTRDGEAILKKLEEEEHEYA